MCVNSPLIMWNVRVSSWRNQGYPFFWNHAPWRWMSSAQVFEKGVLVSTSSVESSVKNPKRVYISSASLRKLEDSSSTPLWEGYVMSGESKSFKARRPNSLLFSPSSCFAGKRSSIFFGLSILENVKRTLTRKVGNRPPSDAVPYSGERRPKVHRCERLKTIFSSVCCWFMGKKLGNDECVREQVVGMNIYI